MPKTKKTTVEKPAAAKKSSENRQPSKKRPAKKTLSKRKPAAKPESENVSAANAVSGEVISIRSARVNNLKDVSLDLPRNSFVVITGVSGSGKSSLAFDTLFAEGQRQYIESLSIYARQFIDQLERPDVDSIEGLQPSLCIDQRQGAANPRSTVGTITEVYDYLRLLFARCGTPLCSNCGSRIDQQSRSDIESSISSLPDKTRVIIMAPMVRGRQGKHADVFAAIRKAGLVKTRVNGEQLDIDEVPELQLRKRHTIEAVVDRIIIRDEVEQRVSDAVDLALRLAGGLVSISYLLPERDDWQQRIFSTLYACTECGNSLEELEPRTFSFNSPYGCCPNCDGVGRLNSWDIEAIVPDWQLSPSKNAIRVYQAASPTNRKKLKSGIVRLLSEFGVSWEDSLGELTKKQRKQFLGSHEKITGLLGLLQQFAESDDLTTIEEHWLYDFIGPHDCPECDGSRLHAAARSVRFCEQTIDTLCRMPISQLLEWFETLPGELSDDAIAKPIVQEMNHRLRFLNRVGVGYLTLGRNGNSLSGGELQRVRLATSIGSGLVGVCYVLDEPSIGLHQQDNDILIESIRDLQAHGNSIIVVEHDESMMKSSDWLVDVGPGAGKQGGEIVAEGTPDIVAQSKKSITAAYLSGAKKIETPNERRPHDGEQSIQLCGVSTQNLQNVNVRFPIGCLIGISGVSGSGKSSLINQTLAPAVRRQLGLVSERPGPYETIEGLEWIDKLIQIDQKPIGKTSRSTPATYCGVFDEIRKVFAQTRDAKQRGFATNRFSFNAGDGRCSECLGQGQQKIEMNFLADMYVPCSQCSGRRFNRQTLHVRFKGANIADVLEMNISDAADFFANFEKAHRLLDSLCAVGLGYLTLGQPSNTLSGGESQRIKLATELAKKSTGRTLYLLDEPTTGLHTDDISRLVSVLQKIVDTGNTVIVIEHNLDVLKCCDYLVDLGPNGGLAGGQIVASGTPEQIANCSQSITGRFLTSLL